MKILRYRKGNEIKPGILDQDEKIRDASSLVKDWDDQNITVDNLNKIISEDLSSLPIIETIDSIAPCVKKNSIGKFICIGLNYSDHAEETGMEVPPEPIMFFKATSAVIGPNDNVIIPKKSVKSDWEVELGVVIGREAKYISEEQSQDYIAGYCVVNDLSEREFQLEHSGQWVKGKSCDSFAPVGPFIATSDEIKDPNNLDLWLKLNGEVMQKSNTSDFIFNIQYVVSYISQFMTLLPGDIISTGTPFGVGMGLTPPRYLKEGDVVELGIEGLGTSKQRCVKFK